MGQYRLGKTKPKQALRSTRNTSKKLLKKLFNRNFYRTNCPVSSDSRNLTMTTAKGLIFLLFNIASARVVPFAMPCAYNEFFLDPPLYPNHPCFTTKSVDFVVDT